MTKAPASQTNLADPCLPLIDQLELQLEELETAATEDVLTAGEAAEKASTVRALTSLWPTPDAYRPADIYPLSSTRGSPECSIRPCRC